MGLHNPGLYVLLDFPETIVHTMEDQTPSPLESLSAELLLLVLSDLPLIDRISIALTAKRYLAIMAAEGLLRVDPRGLSVARIRNTAFDLMRIASPPSWIAPGHDTDKLWRVDEIDTMRRLIPYVTTTHRTTTYDLRSSAWLLRVKKMVERIGGVPTCDLLSCIRRRTYDM